MMTASEEIVQIVDRDNQVIGAVRRALMREQNLIHRAAYILVFNRNDELFVQERTMNKDIYPGHYDLAAGGVVLAGESYEQAAQRELEEELGVEARLCPHFDLYFEDGHNRVWGRIFSCRHQGPFTLQPEEVAGGTFMDQEKIRALAGEAPFTPDSLLLLDRLEEILARA